MSCALRDRSPSKAFLIDVVSVWDCVGLTRYEACHGDRFDDGCVIDHRVLAHRPPGLTGCGSAVSVVGPRDFKLPLYVSVTPTILNQLRGRETGGKRLRKRDERIRVPGEGGWFDLRRGG